MLHIYSEYIYVYSDVLDYSTSHMSYDVNLMMGLYSALGVAYIFGIYIYIYICIFRCSRLFDVTCVLRCLFMGVACWVGVAC